MSPARVALACGLLLAPLPASAGGFGFDRFSFDVHGGYHDLTAARRSALAVFGSRGGATFGGGVAYAFGRGIYVAASARYFGKSGERVFVPDASGDVFRLGHPLEVRIVPVRLSVGYRLERNRFWTPYAGLGGGVTSYRERSTVGGVTDIASESKASGHVLAGVELGRKRLRFGVEVGYSLVPDVVGTGGVSKVYGEDDVGGFSVVGKVVLRIAR